MYSVNTSVHAHGTPLSSNVWLNAATRREWGLVFGTFIALMLLNISLFNHSIGIFLLAFLCFFSMRSPPSALLALSASQAVGDLSGFPFTLAQSFFIAGGWHLLFMRGSAGKNEVLRKLLKWVLPYILITKVLTSVKWGVAPFISSYDLAILVAVMVAMYANRLQGRYMLGLICVGLGLVTSVLTFWISMSGIGIEGIIHAKSPEIMAGVGIGRGDGNYSGVSIALAAVLFLAIGLLSKQWVTHSPKINRLLPKLFAVLFFISIPAIFATMSRGSVITFFGGASFVIAAAFFANKSSRRKLAMLGLVACMVGLFSSADSFGLMNKYIDSMFAYSEQQAAESIMLSRSNVWSAAWQEIVNSPLIGTRPETRVATDAYGYEYASHNVWLDVGRGSGIPGMLWFMAFFLYPISCLFRFLPKSDAAVFCAPFVVLFFVFMNLSLINYKAYYIFWVLAVAVSFSAKTTSKPRSSESMR